ncbi:MAG: tetratricopeptide repeat protein [Terrimicrobiaceae bacterium]|nr:tetratricopeptide repeat protein [Terrimicrobiaceae bacterium]
MKIETETQRVGFRALAGIGLAVAMGCLTACERTAAPHPTALSPIKVPGPIDFALAPQAGEGRADKEIRRFQDQVRRGVHRDAALERLGWAFVAKARESFDPGYYKLAEACAQALESSSPESAEAMLLRGHVLDSLHHFKEAEPIARKLVARRGLSFDYALLGDVLMEQGRLTEAIPAYQTAMNLRPDLHSYARAAHVRWLTGDLGGAIELMRAAVGATSPEDPAAVSWTCSRLAALEFQAGSNAEAVQACDAALASSPDYPPALLLRGRMLLARGDARAAVASLERAAQENPLPDSQWAFADALRADGREADAEKVESLLRERGAAGDPRTLSLFLATRGRDPDAAVRLAAEELKQRQDVFTHDALAWALCAANRVAEARAEMHLAVAEATEDGRLFFHAAVIAARAGQTQEAQDWMARAAELKHLLLPSERTQLDQLEGRMQSAAKLPRANHLFASNSNGGEEHQPHKTTKTTN